MINIIKKASGMLMLLLFPAIVTANITSVACMHAPGWPTYTGYPGMSAPILADFDLDYPGLEVIVAHSVIAGLWSERIYVWHQDGTVMNNWGPRILDEPAHYTPTAVGDLDKDGYLDLVIVTGTDDDGNSPKVRAFDYQGALLPGWPKNIGDDATCAPVLADLDGDGYLDVLVSSKDGKLYIWRYDGSSFNTAWPKSHGGTLYDSPAVGNLDDDDELEIVIGGSNYNIYVWNINGSTLNPNWPKQIEYKRAFTPSLGDVDEDGELEIVIGTGKDIDHGRVYVWNADGTIVSGDWPKSTSGYPFECAISDIDPTYLGEEIVTSIRYDNVVYAWHYDGTPVIGWPYTLGGDGGHSPAIGDIDGDNSLEIVVGSYDSKVYAINSDGSTLPGWPKLTGYTIQTSPAIGDIDDDEKTEIAQPSGDGRVYMWQVSGTGFMTWPMLQHDEGRTGFYLPLISVELLKAYPRWHHLDLSQYPSQIFYAKVRNSGIESVYLKVTFHALDQEGKEYKIDTNVILLVPYKTIKLRAIWAPPELGKYYVAASLYYSTDNIDWLESGRKSFVFTVVP